MTRTWRWTWLAAALAVAGCGDDDSEPVDAADAEAFEEADVGGDVADVLPDAPDVPVDVEPEDAGDTYDGTGVCEQQFWIYDLSVMPPRDRQICASRHGVGEHAYVWVEDEQWGPSVDAEGVAEILLRWDHATPDGSVAPDQGIFEIETGLFGDPPDVFDADPKIYILTYGMEPFGSTSFDGYFRAADETTAPTSNRRELLHINSLSGRPVASPYMIAVMAHEFNHMIQYRWDSTEETWLSESLAELAMIVCGYLTDQPAANAWARNPTAPLIVDGVGNPVDYGAAFLFGAYLLDRLSAAGVTELLADPAHGTGSVETAVELAEPGTTFLDFFADFALAVALDDETVGDGRYGFLALELPRAGAQTVTFPAAATSVTVPGGGIKLVRIPLDGAAHTAIRLEVSAGGAVRLGARAALVDATAGTLAMVLEPGTAAVLMDVPATATEILVALATDEELAVTASVSAADE